VVAASVTAIGTWCGAKSVNRKEGGREEVGSDGRSDAITMPGAGPKRRNSIASSRHRISFSAIEKRFTARHYSSNLIRSTHTGSGLQDLFDSDRQITHPLAGRVVDGVGDRRCNRDGRQLAQSLRAERARLLVEAGLRAVVAAGPGASPGLRDISGAAAPPETASERTLESLHANRDVVPRHAGTRRMRIHVLLGQILVQWSIRVPPPRTRTGGRVAIHQPKKSPRPCRPAMLDTVRIVGRGRPLVLQL
jgi:hypothetical protein